MADDIAALRKEYEQRKHLLEEDIAEISREEEKIRSRRFVIDKEKNQRQLTAIMHKRAELGRELTRVVFRIEELDQVKQPSREEIFEKERHQQDALRKLGEDFQRERQANEAAVALGDEQKRLAEERLIELANTKLPPGYKRRPPHLDRPREPTKRDKERNRELDVTGNG